MTENDTFTSLSDGNLVFLQSENKTDGMNTERIKITKQEWRCSVCGGRISVKPKKNALCQICGKGRYRRIFHCQTCGKEFVSRKACVSRTPKFCSSECFSESNKKYKICALCGEKFADYTKKKYCSVRCRIESRRGVHLSMEMRLRLSEGRKKSPKCHGENLYNWKGGERTAKERRKISYYRHKSKNRTRLDGMYLRRLLAAQGNKCFYCDADLSGYRAIEHLTPFSRGGDNDSFNIVFSCQSCNSRKRDLTLEEYAIKTRQFDLIDKYDLIMAEALL